MAAFNVAELDLYEILGIDQNSSSNDIKKAYRKKALSCHPDKNPEDAKAAERFHSLSKALEILIDVSARSAYDKVFNAKKEAEVRHRQLDTRRKKLKEDLEAKEQASMKTSSGIVSESVYAKPQSDEDKLKAEIERLRKQGCKELEEEIELIRQQLEEERNNVKSFSNGISSNIMDHSASSRLRLRWVNEDCKSVYTDEVIRDIFSKYGSILAIVVSSKKNNKPNSKGGAIVEFEHSASADRAYRFEKGFDKCPLTVEYMNHKEDIASKSEGQNNFDCKKEDSLYKERDQFPGGAKSFPLFFDSTKNAAFNNFSAFSMGGSSSSMNEHLDFESLVLRRMRQAQERKRIEEEIRAKDNDTG